MIQPGDTVTVDLEGSEVFRVVDVTPNVIINGYAEDSSDNRQPMDGMTFPNSEREINLIMKGINPDSRYKAVQFKAPHVKEPVSFAVILLWRPRCWWCNPGSLNQNQIQNTMPTDFKIIQAGDKGFFERQVVEQLEDGWQLHGPMYMYPYPANGESSFLYTQAITREYD